MAAAAGTREITVAAAEEEATSASVALTAGEAVITEPPATPVKLARRLEAWSGDSVVVTGTSVLTNTVAVGVRVTVTVTIPLSSVEVPDAVSVELASVELALVVELDVSVPLPKIPPVAPVASITDVASFSLVHCRNYTLKVSPRYSTKEEIHAQSRSPSRTEGQSTATSPNKATSPTGYPRTGLLHWIYTLLRPLEQ